MRVATKKDSIGVCFCPLDYRSFLKREVPAEQLPGRGHFLDEKGEILGWHEGYPFYTIGQRRGLGASSESCRICEGNQNGHERGGTCTACLPV